jgi:hypothetical protein
VFGEDHRRTRIIGLTVAVLVAAIAAVFIDGEVDVPEWANVPGVDLPFVGDDPLRCDVIAVDATTVQVELSGAPNIIDDYVHLYVNGEPAQESVRGERSFAVSLPEDGSDTHLSVATTPEANERFWCGTANNREGVTER